MLFRPVGQPPPRPAGQRNPTARAAPRFGFVVSAHAPVARTPPERGGTFRPVLEVAPMYHDVITTTGG